MSIIPSVAVDAIEQSTTSTSTGKTFYVGGTGENNYTWIQNAINDANDGDTVLVYDESSPYYELLVITKTINLIGENKHTTVIDAEHDDTPIEISNADNCLISGFTIQNCYSYNSEVVSIFHSNNVTIKDNILTIGDISYNDWTYAIELDNSSYCTIQDNTIFEDYYNGRTIGVILHEDSSNTTISGNDISNHSYGISLISDNNEIYENNIHHNRCGIEIYRYGNNFGNGNIIKNNIISFNKHRGIDIDNGENNLISGNIIMNNGQGYHEYDAGIWLFGCVENYISKNHISNNNPEGLYVDFSHKIVITRNNFIDNVNNTFFSNDWWRRKFNVNRWYRNYWSDSKTGGFLPKIIPGEIMVKSIVLYHTIPWFDIDLRPANKPYDIGV